MQNNLIQFSNPRDLNKSSPDDECGKFYYDTKNESLYIAANPHNLEIRGNKVGHPILINLQTGVAFSICDGTFGDRGEDFVKVTQPFEIKPHE